ncbi:MAG: 50S ribosomal protein L18 [Calditrichaeota bacterium]|nr:50S ribosomal protein L18 [Calditrichota bacterium]MCB9472275.1 50S ribosomal protein L18 [Candidatus Delongbacteria bacterium]
MRKLNIDSRARRHMHIRKKVSGSALKPRLSVFRSTGHIYAQLIDDETGVTLVAASSLSADLKESLGSVKPSERSKLVGKAIAERALAKDIDTCVFDRSGYAYLGRVKALADGAREGGLKF